MVFAVFLLLGVIRGVPLFIIRGTAMAPTYNDGDVLLINKFAKQLSRGDVVGFRNPRAPSQFFMKRIIGLPEEKVEIRAGRVFINGAELGESYYRGETEESVSITLTSDQYFILGDNRPFSSDSRSFGPITRSSTTAKVSGVLYHASK